MRLRLWVCLLLTAGVLFSLGCGRKRCECREGVGFAAPGCCPDAGLIAPPAGGVPVAPLPSSF